MRSLLLFSLFAFPAAAADPPWLLARLGNDRFRQEHAVTALTYSPDGKLLASADGDSVIVWDASNGRRVKVIPIERHDIFGLRFSPDGRTLYAAANDDRSTRLCKIDPGSGNVRANIALRAGKSRGKFSDDGNWLALRPLPIRESELGRVMKTFDHFQVISTATGRDWTQTLGETEARSFAFRGDGKVIAVGCKGGCVRTFDLSTGRTLRNHELASDWIMEVLYSPDGKDLVARWHDVSGSGRTKIRRFDAESGAVHWSYDSNYAMDLAFSADGRELVFNGLDVLPSNWLRLNANNGQILEPPAGFGPQNLTAFCIKKHQKNTLLAQGGGDGIISQLDLSNRKRLLASTEPVGEVSKLKLAGTKVRGWSYGVNEWDIKTGKHTQLTLSYFPGLSNPFALSGDMKLLAKQLRKQTDDKLTTIEITDLTGRERKRSIPETPVHSDLFFLSNRRLAVRCSSGVTVYDTQNGKSLVEIETNVSRGGHHFTDDGKLLVAVERVGSEVEISRYSLDSGKLLSEWSGELADFRHSNEMSGSSYLAANGRFVALHSKYMNSPNVIEEHTVLLDTTTGRMLGDWKGTHSDSIAFTPDCRSVLLYSRRPFSYYLFEVASGEYRAQVNFGLRPLSDFAFSPDGRKLIVATRPYPVEIWDANGDAGPWEPKHADKHWSELASPKADQAYKSIRLLLNHPPEAAAFLRERVKVPQAPPAEWIADRLKLLDAAGFKDREKATAELATSGEVVYSRLRAALPTASAEARARIEGILSQADKMTPEKLRAVRVCEIAEGLGTAEGKAMLEAWAKGAEGTTLVREAKTSLERVVAREK